MKVKDEVGRDQVGLERGVDTVWERNEEGNRSVEKVTTYMITG